MKSDFINAFKDVVREQIVRKNSVHVEGLGQFRVAHKKQKQKKYDSGKVVMVPPEDVIEFKPQIKSGDEN